MPMPWYAYSILSSLSLVGLNLAIRRLTGLGFAPKQILVFMIGLALLGFGVAAGPNLAGIITSDRLSGFLFFATLAGLFTSIGHWADFEAIGRAPNPGYPAAIKNTNILPVTLFSVVLFNGSLQVTKLAFMLLILSGILILLVEKKQAPARPGKAWLARAFIALAGYSGATLAMKKATLLGFRPPEICLWIYFINFLFFLLVTRKQWRGYFKDKARLKLFLPLVVACAGLAFGVNIFNVQALTLAPNLGYHEAIRNSSVVFITLLAVPLFSASLDLRKMAGIVITLAGVIFLVL